MKKQVEVMRELKTGKRLLLIINLTIFPHLRCHDFGLRYLAFALDNFRWFFSFIMKGVRIIYFDWADEIWDQW